MQLPADYDSHDKQTSNSLRKAPTIGDVAWRLDLIPRVPFSRMYLDMRHGTSNPAALKMKFHGLPNQPGVHDPTRTTRYIEEVIHHRRLSGLSQSDMLKFVDWVLSHNDPKIALP